MGMCPFFYVFILGHYLCINYDDTSTVDPKYHEHYLQLSQTEKDMVDMVCDNFDDVIVLYNGANQFELGFADEYPQIKSVVWCPGILI